MTTRQPVLQAIFPCSAFAAAALLIASLAAPALAADGAVYSMSNSPLGNEVIILQRNELDGTLTIKPSVATGGMGTGTSLGNQGALALSDDKRWMLVVNPGSSSISTFAVLEDGLQLVGTFPSGGRKPVSIDVYGDLVAVLNAGGDVGVHDNVVVMVLSPDGTLGKLRGRLLSEDVTSPAQVSFVQEGHVLVVTEKATAMIDTICMRRNGALGKAFFHDAGRMPFGFTSVSRDHILVTDAVLGTVTTYQVDRQGGLQAMGTPLDTTELATCWAVATPGNRFVYTTNTESNTVSGIHVDFDAALTLLDPTGVTATSGALPLDAALSGDGHFLYVLASGPDAINVYRVHDNGSLTPIETKTGLPDGANGLVAR